VTVPLQKYHALDYGKADLIIKAGYDAAASKASTLAAFSISEAECEQYLSTRNARRKTASTLTFVQVIGTSPEMAKAMEKQMSSIVGEPVDTKKVAQEMMTVVRQGRFATATYSMVEKNGDRACEFRLSRSHTRLLSYALLF
jgi:NTE family protein